MHTNEFSGEKKNKVRFKDFDYEADDSEGGGGDILEGYECMADFYHKGKYL